jgi:hypothetical protein
VFTHLRGVHATSIETAWAVGVNGIVLKTTNSGSVWEIVNTGVPYNYSDIYFVDYQIGWIAGGDTAHGTILHTTNGGTTWNLQNTNTSNFLFSVYFTDPDTGWAVGYDGTIIHTTNGGTSVEEAEILKEIPHEIFLAQNTPNPFSRTSVFSFSIPAKRHISLKLYNIIGQEVAVLADGGFEAGEHSVIFDGRSLPSGVYLYRLDTGDQIKTKRCIVLK